MTLLYVRLCEVRLRFRSYPIAFLCVVSFLVSLGVFYGKAGLYKFLKKIPHIQAETRPETGGKF